MTLQDLWLMIKHYSRWVILVPIICGVLAGGASALLGMVNGSATSGAMAKSQWVGNYYLTGSGAMATNTWIGKYHVSESGVWDQTR